MTDQVIPPPMVVALPVAGRPSAFEVRRVYCMGRNDAAHAIKMGRDPDRGPPFFFRKNPDNLDPSGHFPYPSGRSDVYHEAERLAALKRGGTNIPVDRALECVYGTAICLAMIWRDVQGAVGDRMEVSIDGLGSLTADVV